MKKKKIITAFILATLSGIFAVGCVFKPEQCNALPLVPSWTFSNSKPTFYFQYKNRKCSISTAYDSDLYKGSYFLFTINPQFHIKEAELISESGEVIKGIIKNDNNVTKLRFYMEIPDIPSTDKYILIINGPKIKIKLRVTRKVEYKF